MISEKAIDALESCRNILIEEIRQDLENTKGHSVEVGICFLNGSVDVDIIRTVYLDGEDIKVDYEDDCGQIYTDSIELFSVDELSNILSAF